MQKFIEIHYSKGFAFGVAYQDNILQVALFFILIEFHFSVVKSNFSKFVQCFKEN